MPADKPVALHGGADMRAAALVKALKALIYERGSGMPVPTILGCLRIVEIEIYEEQR